jgi:signal peptidase II
VPDKAANAMNRMNPRAIAVAGVLTVLGVALDQWTKAWAAARLPGAPLDVIPNALTLAYVENRNAAFGLGHHLPDSIKTWVLIGLTSGLTVALIIAMVRATDLASQIGFASTICGALGNIVDRVRLGYVRDFILVHHDSFVWPNFNVADMLVCIGVGVLLVFGGRKKPAKDAAGAAAPKP